MSSKIQDLLVMHYYIKKDSNKNVQLSCLSIKIEIFKTPESYLSYLLCIKFDL